MKDNAHTFFWLAGVCALISHLALWIWFVPGGLPSGNTSGVWTALADDFSRGILYRPVFNEFGYGGTRYMPLYFMLHGWLIQMFGDPVSTGFILTFFSIAILDLGSFLVLRELQVKPQITLPLVLLAHATITFQFTGLEVRGDFLASACNVWGFYFVLRFTKNKNGKNIIYSSICFLTAFFIKFTTVFGIVSAFLLLYSRQQSSALLRLIGILTCSACFILAGLYFWSEGKILASFQACALGGYNFSYAFKTPFWFLWTVVQDPFFLILLLLTLFTFFRGIKFRKLQPIEIYFCMTFILSVAIFSSPGTGTNHLIDLIVACSWILGLRFTQGNANGWIVKGLLAALSLATILVWLPGMPSIKSHIERRERPQIQTVELIQQRLGSHTKNLLSENPLLPILMGQRPIVMDAFSLRLIAHQSKTIRKDFEEKMRSRFFDAVILLDWSGAPLNELEQSIREHSSFGVDSFYGGVHFPSGFLDLLKSNYYLSFVKRPYLVFEPKNPKSTE